MRNVVIIEANRFVSMPWRNGAGSTTELIKRKVPGGEGFAWRISMAAVVEDGQFSDFSGYDRTLVLLEGGGLTLDYANKPPDSPDKSCRDILDKPLQMAHFDGGNATHATLHQGPIKDFNIMTRSGICQAQTTSGNVKNPVRIMTAAGTLLAFAVEGDLTITDSRKNSVVASAGALTLIEPPVEDFFSFNGLAFIVVEIFNCRADH